jgi:hypothetical protein
MPFHSPHRRDPRPPNPPFRPRASVPAPFIVRMASSADRESMKQKLPVRPYDEMSTTGAMTRVTDVPRSYRPKARPEGLRERAEQRRMQGLEERSLRSQERESQDYEDFGGGHQGGPAKKFKDGGMVRGAKPGQTSGTKFSGTF